MSDAERHPRWAEAWAAALEQGELENMAVRAEYQEAEISRARFTGRLERQMRADKHPETDIEAAVAHIANYPPDYWLELQAGRRPPSDL